MSFQTLGDLAQNLALRRDTARVASSIQTLSRELATGRVADIRAAVGGDFGPLSGIERDLARIASVDLVVKEAALTAAAGNAVLSRIARDAQDVSSALMLARDTANPSLVDNAANDARQRFEAAISGLNTQVAGRSLFSGQAFDRASFPSGSQVLDDLLTALAGETALAGVRTAIDSWFADGGVFDTTVFQGSSVEAVPVRLGNGETARPVLLGIDPAIKATLKGFALAAVMDRGVLANTPDQRAELAFEAGNALLSASSGLTDARARIGTAEGAVERAKARLSAEKSALEIARNRIVGADPFETGSRLRLAETQLQSMYVLTGRLANLTLTAYLR